VSTPRAEADPSRAPEPSAAVSPVAPSPTQLAADTPRPLALETYDVPAGARPHDVAPAPDGGVWYTAQARGAVGLLDPATGEAREFPLGPGSAPHGVIVGPDGAPWITDGGLNAIVRVDPDSGAPTVFRLPGERPDANLNTATFDGDGVVWFTGQSGIYGRLVPETGEMQVYDAPRGAGPYGIATTPGGDVYYSSLAGSYLAAVDRASGGVTVIDTPTPGGGARRVWSDSEGRLWVTEWFAGGLARYDPASGAWTEWGLPSGTAAMPYAVYVDETDAVWVTDFGANALLRFDQRTETFEALQHESWPANVRQLLGKPGEVWGAESAADRLVVVRFGD
jgi:virginiamycin B lyase